MRKGKKYIAGILCFMSISSAVHASWFSKDKEVELKPAHGYTEKMELVTNAWSKAIVLYQAGERVINFNDMTVAGNIGYTNFSSCGSLLTTDSLRISYHDCPKCTREHTSAYPKTATVVSGIQKRVTTTYLRDGKAQAIVVRHEYPHKKRIISTVTSLERKYAVTTVIEDTVVK